ncbi:PEP-CTERM sorting domain-containing protein [Duganella sp. FT135W]|uniref:PEP-CTERM sorting domain-containing protein n=1 Tax=Duganella flavida TaxID=2692175 RepID=A0A6L8K9L7_9BURK|nr:PEP-CTERM sorting domain-containing protein [Duganella flavida]MYM21051.1 PEP-CTERM sorting domain-containing protein [Duganella flavida]
MRYPRIGRIAAIVAALALAPATQAGTFSGSLPEFDGSGANGVETVGTIMFSIPSGEMAVSAVLSGMFGNSTVSSTSIHTVWADGVLVASCPDSSAYCWTTGPQAWSHTFTGAELSIFADGQVVITTNQTDCCVVREGEMSLRGVTAPVPEPESGLMLLAGLGLLSLLKRRRT